MKMKVEIDTSEAEAAIDALIAKVDELADALDDAANRLAAARDEMKGTGGKAPKSR